ncbi:MAG TPA: hypothetical protein VHK24_08245 [Steroidobacter sp.]|nr:hypothetical protein [Steroidobacter sp.]
MSKLQHFEDNIHALDERIGRLALICGADLTKSETVVYLIKGHFETCTRGDAISAQHRDELRALLMMKYKIEMSCIDAIGAEDCARLIFEQDERLRRSGFPPESLP